MSSNFIGKDGFIWWIGINEFRGDPLGLGRCKVRIFAGTGDDGCFTWIRKRTRPNNTRVYLKWQIQ